MQALARKYRPKKLADLIGQPSVVQTLSNAWTNKQLHQAYLFVGQFGSGKTTAARILAAMENCEVSPGLEPCGKCDICVDVFEGRHTDIEELDAAGAFAKVEQVRTLKKAVLYGPVDGARKKYYIVDECHRMSGASNDALLKLLEEPPAHVRFILCTTDVQKMRPAVVSRCQQHDFRKIFWSQIAERLAEVIKLEGVTCDQAALNLCARMAKGSMRNGLQLLEKLGTFVGGNKMTIEDAERMLGTASDVLYAKLFDQVVGVADGKPNASAGFRIINDMLSKGAEFDAIYEGIAEHLEKLMICLVASEAKEFIYISPGTKEFLMNQLRKIKDNQKIEAVITSINKLHEAKLAVAYNLSPEFALRQWFVESIFTFRR